MNSSFVTGVTYRFVIEPSSFSRTTASAGSIEGMKISRMGITAGTIETMLTTPGLCR